MCKGAESVQCFWCFWCFWVPGSLTTEMWEQRGTTWVAGGLRASPGSCPRFWRAAPAPALPDSEWLWHCIRDGHPLHTCTADNTPGNLQRQQLHFASLQSEMVLHCKSCPAEKCMALVCFANFIYFSAASCASAQWIS